jgi:hypothetical protein
MSYINEFIKVFLYDEKVTITIKLFISLIFLGGFIKILTTSIKQDNSTGGIGEATGTIWGYLIILLSLIGLIIIKVDSSTSSTTQLVNNENGIIPWYFYILTPLILWIIYLNVTYFKQINKQTTPPNYSYWNLWSTLFILALSVFIAVNEITNKADTFGNKEKGILKVSIGFILFLVFIITGIQHTILQNFSVDG